MSTVYVCDQCGEPMKDVCRVLVFRRYRPRPLHWSFDLCSDACASSALGSGLEVPGDLSAPGDDT